MALNEIFKKLLDTYSCQGWWPITDYEGENPTKTGSTKGYHPADYSFPRDSGERFEIIIGAVLTQNTSWPQVERSLINLKELVDLTPFHVLDLDEDDSFLFVEVDGLLGEFPSDKQLDGKEWMTFIIQEGDVRSMSVDEEIGG